MKWAYYVKNKMKAVGVLMIIIVLIFGNNIYDRKAFADLDQSISSIYKDRLMPATYIFQLTNHLYQKRMLHETVVPGNLSTINENEHNKAITELIKNFEATYLTPAEKQQWMAFKQNLEEYNIVNKNTADKNDEALTRSFNKALLCLSKLSNIQANEGEHIRASSQSRISSTVIMSQFEIALLLILCIFALILLSATDKKIFQNAANPLLN